MEIKNEYFSGRDNESYKYDIVIMILRREVEKIAQQKQISKMVIDKDWVLGHFIDAIFSIPKCRNNLIFKGGTCLRKCYFKDYRFSEDLDFTATDPEFILDKNLLDKIKNLVIDRTEIPLHIHELKELNFKDTLTGYSATIKYWGADHSRNQPPPPPKRWQSSIKLEIILYEKMIFPSELKPIHHEYSDELSDSSITIPCYSIEEVLAEKLRSIIQRSYTAPRDFYDIWFLSRNVRDLEWSKIIDAFHEKMKFKGLAFEGIDQLINNENDKRLLGAWENSLGHQVLGKLPDYYAVKKDLQILLNSNLK